MLEKMFQDMLSKALPPEIMALLTPEKIEEMGRGINAYVLNSRESLARIEAQNRAIMAALNVVDPTAAIDEQQAIAA